MEEEVASSSLVAHPDITNKACVLISASIETFVLSMDTHIVYNDCGNRDVVETYK